VASGRQEKEAESSSSSLREVFPGRKLLKMEECLLFSKVGDASGFLLIINM